MNTYTGLAERWRGRGGFTAAHDAPGDILSREHTHADLD